MVKHETYSTLTHSPWSGRPMDLDDNGAERFYAPCAGMVSGSAQVELLQGTGSAFVLTVQVSNDPRAQAFVNHPSAVTLTNSAQITAVFSLVGYLWYGVKLTTVNGGNLLGHVHLCAKDSPA